MNDEGEIAGVSPEQSFDESVNLSNVFEGSQESISPWDASTNNDSDETPQVQDPLDGELSASQAATAAFRAVAATKLADHLGRWGSRFDDYEDDMLKSFQSLHSVASESSRNIGAAAYGNK